MSENQQKNARKFAHAKARKAQPTLYELEAEAMKALANPKRLLILDLLSDGRERNVGDLLAETSMSQSNLSQNLAVMRAAGLLATRRDGNLIYYRITDTRVVRAVTLMRSVMAQQVEDHQFLLERAAQKHKERVRRATLGAYVVLGAMTMLALFASIHPLAVGGGFAEVGQHAQLMMESGSFAGLLETCASVGPGDPTGGFARMAAMTA